MYFTILLRSARPRAVLLMGATLCCWPAYAGAAAATAAATATAQPASLPAALAYSAGAVAPVAATPAGEDAAKPPVKQNKPSSRRTKVPAKAASAAPDPVGVAALTGPADAAAPAGATGTSWDIVMSDKTLNGAMARWAAAAGWQLSWELPVDYAVQARTSVPGSFDEAVTQVVNSMEGAEIPMQAIFYKGNKVLRILAKGAR